MSKIVGLTGGIATGKSLVSSFLNQQGIPIVDADQITRQVEAKDTLGLDAIVTEFGVSILQSDGQLNRQLLGQIVFSDVEKLRLLVRTIDPFIRNQITKEIRNLASHPLIVLDSPTLFENGYQQLVDEVLMVSCTANIQLQRLMSRNQLSITQANQRIKAQWPIEIKQLLADYVIYNSDTKDKTYQQVVGWLNKQQVF
ncbi:dephospho-CoA kinase [Lentilactobacillus senioris DSM 24302 = JCM 17472]|uniref:Dephospho-CoA kinase n=1 Tax=Lentilactobacillus senioris DSM 24302 = JCM 17472 TaxID=1423802 RepID=A0A0R2CRY5_9LACO|nr:dephospho-CoA kinase [Lentilactobacillus senioris]KRM93952.1 dephospho-CoA kinase [Lentilactobacillus senioris DSM 24302 = JCM 17472]